MKVKLDVTRGPYRGKSVEFSMHDTLVVGRSKDAQFRFPFGDNALSRFHFLIEVNPPSCRIMDMASTNGTYVNGRRVTTVDLNDGDLIKVGRSVMRVAFEFDPPTRMTSSFLIALEQAAFASDGATTSQDDTPAGAAAETASLRVEIPIIPRYRIERELGRGGMGVVYLARKEVDGEIVALKTIAPKVLDSPNALARFLREASLLRQLDHPGIVRFREVGHAQGLLYFAMEYVPGTNAEALLAARRAPMPIGRAVDITSQLLDSLSYAHALGIVHRDVKPSNLLVNSANGRDIAKVADFGLARLYQDSPMSGLTLAGHVGGTYGFMAPEQITNFREARPAADQYAAAVTLYYLLTGKMMFDFSSRPEEQLRMILEAEPVPIRRRRGDIPAPLAVAVHRAIQRDPAARFPDVDAFREALARSLDGP